MHKKYTLVLSFFLHLTIFASEPIKICHDSITVSDVIFETVDNETFFKSYNENVTACSPGISDMMSYSLVRKYRNGRIFRKRISYFIGKENHPLISALYFSFAKHKNITISPDMIWLTICQGVSTHINLNPDEYRDYFTREEKKRQLRVRNDSLSWSFNDKEWATIISNFSDSLSSYVSPKLFKLFNPTFSTTGLKEKAAFQLTLMNTSKEYYEYFALTACGIPEIVIEGEREDWLWMYRNIDNLSALGLEWWVKELKPILQEFINAFDGNVNKEFWCSILKNKEASGGPLRVNGWIKNLFPYVLNDRKKFVRNEYIGTIDIDRNDSRYASEEFWKWYIQGLKISAFSTGVQKTHFNWEYGKRTYKMIFYSGFLGISYDHEVGMLIPQIGYLVGKSRDDR